MDKGNITAREIIIAFQRTLVGFGYTTLAYDSVERAIRKALKGNHKEDIIAKFIYGWLNGEYKEFKPILEEELKKG